LRIAAVRGGERMSSGFASCIDLRGIAVQKCRTPVQACGERSPMIEKTTQSIANLGYHAHIYYDPTRTRAIAERVCAAIGEKFLVEIDGFRDTPVGPHPIANTLVIFKPDQFEQVGPYLMLNRAGLDVLVHPLTEDAVEDHSSYAIWLGNPVELKLHTLPRGRGGRLPSGVSA
jgi:aromatic ring-cleaving dioxygenase